MDSRLRRSALRAAVNVIERILRHLNEWDPAPETVTTTGPDPPIPEGENLPLTYHTLPDVAQDANRKVAFGPMTAKKDTIHASSSPPATRER